MQVFIRTFWIMYTNMIRILGGTNILKKVVIHITVFIDQLVEEGLMQEEKKYMTVR